MPAKVAFGAIQGIVPIALFAMNAIRNIRPVLLRTGYVLRLAPSSMVRHVILPAAMPEIVTGVRLRNLKTNEVWDQDVDGFFLAIGHIPNTKVFKGQIETDPDGYILSKGGARTNISGVFHAGDVQDRTYRQAITASGAGCMAAIEVERFLEAEGH